MSFSFASQASRQDRAEFPFYRDDLLPALQSALAMLADLDTRYETERDHLAGWSGSDEVKERFVAALEAGWRRDREPILARLDRLQGVVPDQGHPRHATQASQRVSGQCF